MPKKPKAKRIPVDVLSNTSATECSSEETDDDRPFSRKGKPQERFTYEGREFLFNIQL